MVVGDRVTVCRQGVPVTKANVTVVPIVQTETDNMPTINIILSSVHASMSALITEQRLGRLLGWRVAKLVLMPSITAPCMVHS
jgi:hypothetical protein